MAGWKWTTDTIKMDATDTGRVFDRLIREFGNPKEINRISAMTALEGMQRAFAQGRNPETGSPWRKLRPNTVAAKGHSVPLFRTGKLRTSLEKGRPGNVFLVSSKRAKVGSRLKTAVLAQQGTKPHTIRARRKKFLRFVTTAGVQFRRSVSHPGTPPRPIVGISRGTLGEIDKRINRYLDTLQKQGGGR